jgi:hypothetical protein
VLQAQVYSMRMLLKEFKLSKFLSKIMCFLGSLCNLFNMEWRIVQTYTCLHLFCFCAFVIMCKSASWEFWINYKNYFFSNLIVQWFDHCTIWLGLSCCPCLHYLHMYVHLHKLFTIDLETQKWYFNCTIDCLQS